MVFIGDPTPIGWLVTVAYLIGGWYSWQSSISLRKSQQPFWFWTLIALFVTFLAINKQLDMQSWLHNWGRALVRDFGFQGDTYPLKLFLLAVLACILLLGSVILVKLFLYQHFRPWGAMFGCLLLFLFVLLRALAFNHVGVYGSEHVGWAALELVGVALILVSSFYLKKSLKR